MDYKFFKLLIITFLLGVNSFSQEIDSLQIKLTKFDQEKIQWLRYGNIRSAIDKEILKNTKIQDTIRLKYELKVDSIGRIKFLNNIIANNTLKSKLENLSKKEYKVTPFKSKGININMTSDRYNLYLLEDNEQYKMIFPEFKTATFVGCEGNNSALKKCMNSNINKHIVKNFNSDLANDLGLSAGRKRIWVRFEINKEGKVQNVNAKAPHPILRVEGERVIKLLPTLIPGEFDGKKVKVPYSIPIVFVVEDSTPVKTKAEIKAEKRRLRKLR